MPKSNVSENPEAPENKLNNESSEVSENMPKSKVSENPEAPENKLNNESSEVSENMAKSKESENPEAPENKLVIKDRLGLIEKYIITLSYRLM
ncbi:hypothetical protein F8M41_016087 [Gigaspora margarita]|uniref:Uncharacterized protein n=1 Tax=Gigaspora margarita TaxID=4874 RepID=A0A8H4APW2_GIGMA|nr:hypothetical protein F8M41_016087 [Gigaspora margarita]